MKKIFLSINLKDGIQNIGKILQSNDTEKWRKTLEATLWYDTNNGSLSMQRSFTMWNKTEITKYNITSSKNIILIVIVVYINSLL